MLSYRHGFHAGNFADVHKHLALALVLEALRIKEKPFFVLDTHAGAGVYDLSADRTRRLDEWREGIGRIWPAGTDAPLPDLYRQALSDLNRDGSLRHYPGSPAIIRCALRPGDRAVLVELHTAEAPMLEAWAADDRRLSVVCRDGFGAVLASVPPKERRGLVLVDPPYEIKTDYRTAAETLIRAHRKWSTGIYLLWYPLLAERRERAMLEMLERSGIRRILVSEWLARPDNGQTGMYGSGVAVINPPWKLDTRLAGVMTWLARAADSPPTASQVTWLVPD